MSVASDIETIRCAAMILAGFRRGELAEKLSAVAIRLEDRAWLDERRPL